MPLSAIQTQEYVSGMSVDHINGMNDIYSYSYGHSARPTGHANGFVASVPLARNLVTLLAMYYLRTQSRHPPPSPL